MTVAVAVAAARTSTGTQDITTADLAGATPKAVILLYSRGAVDGTISAHSGTSWGFADGTAQYALATYSRDAVTSSVNSVARVGKSDKCITQLHYSGAVVAVHSEASFVSFIADGVRIDWTTATADGWFVTALFFQGSDWTIALGDSTTTTSGVTVATGWQPDALFLVTSQNAIAGSIETTRNSFSFGVSTWSTGALEQRIFFDWGWGITRQNVTQLNDDYGGYQFEPTNTYGVHTTRSATGFTITKSGDPTTTTKFVYLAIKYTGTGKLKTGDMRISTSSGNQVITGMGGQTGPFIILFPHAGTQETIGRNVSQYGHYFATATKMGGYSNGSVSDTNPTNASFPQDHANVHATDKFRRITAVGVENVNGTLASFDVNGVTLNFSNAPENAEDWLYFTIVGYGVTPVGHSQAWIID